MINPAVRSSHITPNPFGSCSIKRIGHGFIISKNRNNINTTSVLEGISRNNIILNRKYEGTYISSNNTNKYKISIEFNKEKQNFNLEAHPIKKKWWSRKKGGRKIKKQKK